MEQTAYLRGRSVLSGDVRLDEDRERMKTETKDVLIEVCLYGKHLIA
jgi:hypothetical protein